MKNSIISYSLLFLVEIVIMVIGAASQVMWLFYLFLALILIEAIAMLIKSIVKYEYKCKKCSTIFNPSVKEKLFGINSGDIKKLYCPHCESRQWCMPVKKKKVNKKK